MDTVSRKVVELNIDDVLPNRFQPRIKFNEDAIVELSKSIKEHGVIQPIVVRPIGDKFEIIAGERRYKASCMASLTTIPAIITDLNDKDSAEVALIENVQRENLTPIEEAISYKKILDMGYITQDALATKLGKNQSTVANKLRLLNLDDTVQEALLNEKISERHARSLLKLIDKQQQKEMLNKIINERLTVRRADEEIEKILNGTIPMIEESKNTELPTQPIEESLNDTNNDFPPFKFVDDKPLEKVDEEITELKNNKFFNILSEVDNENETPESYDKMFINQTKLDNNAMLEELEEIEKSINNSTNIGLLEQEQVEEIEKIEDFDEELEFIEEENTPSTIESLSELNSTENIEETEDVTDKETPSFIQKKKKINSFKEVIENIRTCSDDIENAGYRIETEEYDLDGVYQIIFKIEKK